MLKSKRESWYWRFQNLMNISNPLERLCKLLNHNFDIQRILGVSDIRQKTPKSGYGVLAVNHVSGDISVALTAGFVKRA